MTEQRPSDDENLLAALRDGIAEARFTKQGRLLPERRLAEMLGVSRGGVRRALGLLEAEGEIFRRQGQGTFAMPPPPVEGSHLRHMAARVSPEEVMEGRFALEPEIAAIATARATADDVAMLEHFACSTLETEDAEAYEVADDLFHYRIAAVAGNVLLRSFCESIREVRRHAAWEQSRARVMSPDVRTTLGNQHLELVECIRTGDARMARQTMLRHLREVASVMEVPVHAGTPTQEATMR